MNFKIIIKQIYKGFLINWKLFAMLILFCISTLAMVLGSLFFLVQFNNEIYQPAISKNAFSVGYLKNDFTYSDNPNSESLFRTSQEFEDYFLDELNKNLHETNYRFEKTDLIAIYEREGYINLVETKPEQKSAYQQIISWAADYLGNVRFKIFTQYLQANYPWTFNLWNNQENFVKIAGNSDYLHFYNANLKKSQGLIKFRQMLTNNSNFISAYINENRFKKAYQLGDLVTLKFLDKYHSKDMQVKIVGTFVDYVNFASREAQDLSLMIDSTDYFHFVQNQNDNNVSQMVDYHSTGNLSPPILNLLTNEQFSKPNFLAQLNQANQVLDRLFFANFSGSSLSDYFSQTMYFNLHQRMQLTNFMMVGMSFLFLLLFFAVLYFLIMQIIKTDFQTSKFLNNQGMNYAEISLIQIFRLTIPLLISFVLGYVGAFGVKYLFWTTYERGFDVHLDLFYFHWMTFIILLISLVLIFGILFLINFLVNQKLGKEKNIFQRLSFPNWISAKFKKTLRIKNSRLSITLSYGSKNFFQFFFFFLITCIMFVIISFGFNFLMNIQSISDIPVNHYGLYQSLSISKGSVVDEKTKKPTIRHFFFDQEFKPIGAGVNLKEDKLDVIIKKLENLFVADGLSEFYLSHDFTKQVDQEFADWLNKQEWNEELVGIITPEEFDQLKIIVNNAALLNWQLAANFGWTEGFNVNFGKWGGNLASFGNPTFFSLEGEIFDASSNQYLSFLKQCLAVNSDPDDETGNSDVYNGWFEHLNDPVETVTFEKTPSQIAESDLDKAIAEKHDGKVVVDQIINAYFPYSYQEKDFLKLKIDLNSEVRTEVYLRNVGVNNEENWMPTFILNKRQLYQFLKNNSEIYQILDVDIPFSEILDNDLDRLDNGIYISSKIPFLYRNVLLRHAEQENDGKETDNLPNYLGALESLNIFGINIDQIWWATNSNLEQYRQLISSILIFSSILMLSIYLILIYLIVKENEGYFQNFKALGYRTNEIVGFLLPWSVLVIIFAVVCAFLLTYYTNGLIDQILSQMLEMYLNYHVDHWTYEVLIVVPILLVLLIWWIVHAYINRIKVTNIVS